MNRLHILASMLPPQISFKQRLRDSSLTLGAFVFSTDAAMPEIYAAAGFDFVVVDSEHGMNDIHTSLAHLRSARAAGIHALVRIGPSMLGDVPRLLDAGCEGIMLPHFGLPGAGATEALRNTRYSPSGTRPTCTGVSAASYGTASFPAYVERANRDIVTLGLVEDRECVSEIEELLARREVEMIMPGPGDLATSLGVPGQLLHPTVKTAVDTVFSAANKHGTPIGMYVNSPAEIPEWHARGARFFILSIDVKWLALSLKGAAQACRSQPLAK